jgi:hypothetical protein
MKLMNALAYYSVVSIAPLTNKTSYGPFKDRGRFIIKVINIIYHARYFRIHLSFLITTNKHHLAPKYSGVASLEVAPPSSFLDLVS